MILYFSATGNCKRVAEAVAGLGNAGEAVPMTACGLPEPAPGEPVGFVFPTYFWGLPRPVANFLREGQLPICEGRYVFLVAAYGTTTGGSAQMARRLLAARGIGVDASFSARTPDTWTPIFDLSDQGRVAAQVEAAESEIAEVAARVAARERSDFVRARLPYPVARAYHATYGLQARTSAFSVDVSACVGCGLCARKCPVGAIEMRDGLPAWTAERCAMCLGCLHRCPKFAIQRGRATARHGQYANPHTRV